MLKLSKSKQKQQHGGSPKVWHFYVKIFNLDGLQIWTGIEIRREAIFSSIDYWGGIFSYIFRSKVDKTTCQKEFVKNHGASDKKFSFVILESSLTQFSRENLWAIANQLFCQVVKNLNLKVLEWPRNEDDFSWERDLVPDKSDLTWKIKKKENSDKWLQKNHGRRRYSKYHSVEIQEFFSQIFCAIIIILNC